MTGRSSTKRTGLCLLALLLSCLSCDKTFVVGVPVPNPSELLSGKSYINAEAYLLTKLKQVVEEKEDIAEREKTLDGMQMMIQSMLEPRAPKMEARVPIPPVDYSIEELPTPIAVISQAQHSGKRTPPISYMTLCHFKICNMGRKRQLHK